MLEEVTWWQADDFWQYALFAAVAYIRAAAGRADAPVRQACQDLAQSPVNERLACERGPSARGSRPW
jgi:hypothetical protein